MEILVFAGLGVALIALAMFDLFTTVLTTRGGGPVSSRLGSYLWEAFRSLRQRGGSQHLFAYAGPLIAILTVLSWILLLWLGW